VENASEGYKLQFEGTLVIILLLHGNEPANGRMFTTVDNDNDVWSGGKCAVEWKSQIQPPLTN